MGSIVAWLVSGLGLFASAALLSLRLATYRHRNLVSWLEELPADPPPEGWPSVAVLFAARNEQASVERATRSMLAQDYPSFQLIAVDDRSTDETGAILDVIARDDSRLRVVHVQELPPGWLGKNHALQTAADATSASWLLFTDADIVLEPTTLRRAISLAERSGFDHLTVPPDTRTDTLAERAFMAMFCLMFAFHAPAWKVLNRRNKASIGVGAFNLVRAEAFRAIGGFRRLSLSIDDDMKLGEALKFAGYRPGVALNREMITVRWQVGLNGMVRGLEKNFFAGLGFRITAVAFGLVAMLVLGVAPFAGLFVGPSWARILCAVGTAAAASMLASARGQNGLAWYHALLLPLGAIACCVALARSTWLTLRRGGVIWRDHLYPIDELRAHARRRDAWLREVWRSTR